MNDFLKSAAVGNIELQEQKKIHEKIMNRWNGLGFTEGLNGVLKENVAVLYENQAKQMLSEATTSDNSGQFQTVVFPIIRRVFSKLLANDIVSVQAMNMPIGKVFFIVPQTSEREWTLEGNPLAGPDDFYTGGAQGAHKGLMGYERISRVNSDPRPENEPRYYVPDETVADTDGNRLGILDAAHNYGLTQYFKKSLYDLFYDDFLFDNSKGKVTISAVKPTQAKLTFDGFVTSGVSIADLVKDEYGTYRSAIVAISGFNSYNTGKLTGPDGNEQDTEEFLASLKIVAKAALFGTSGASFAQYEPVPFSVKPQKYGSALVEYDGNICNADGVIYLEIDLTKPTTGDVMTTDGYIGVEEGVLTDIAEQFICTWASYDSLELETEIGEVSFTLSSETISVTERKLRATWSPEMQQDVSAFHNIDAEAELTSLLSEQISAELDREILRDLRKVGPWVLRFDVNGWKKIKGFSTNYTQKDWNQELFTKINQISAQINKSTLMGGANFVVVSPEVSALLYNLEYFHVTDASAESDQYNMGIERVGSLNNQLQVYRDSYAPAYSIIIGHKGKSLMDTGYVYAPYIPLQLTPTLTNPFNFAPIKGIMTRYAKKVVNNKFYGAIKVDGLQTWSTAEFR